MNVHERKHRHSLTFCDFALNLRVPAVPTNDHRGAVYTPRRLLAGIMPGALRFGFL